MPKKQRKLRHVPQRTCVGCREVHSKRSLIRIVRNPEGIFIDPSGKIAGRGAYLHERSDCWERGLECSLESALKTELSDKDRERITEFMETLTEKTSAQ